MAAKAYSGAREILSQATGIDLSIHLAFYKSYAYFMKKANKDKTFAAVLLLEVLSHLGGDNLADPKLAEQILAIKNQYKSIPGQFPELLDKLFPTSSPPPPSS